MLAGSFETRMMGYALAIWERLRFLIGYLERTGFGCGLRISLGLRRLWASPRAAAW